MRAEGYAARAPGAAQRSAGTLAGPRTTSYPTMGRQPNGGQVGNVPGEPPVPSLGGAAGLPPADGEPPEGDVDGVAPFCT